MKRKINGLINFAAFLLFLSSSTFAAIIEDWSRITPGMDIGTFADTVGSKISFTTEPGPDGNKAIKLISTMTVNGWCGIWRTFTLDLSRNNSLKFKIKSSAAGGVEIALKDRYNVQYTAHFTVSSGDWTEVTVPFSSFNKDLYFTPPDAIPGHAMDLTMTKNMNFSPKIIGDSVVEIGPIEAVGSASTGAAPAPISSTSSVSKGGISGNDVLQPVNGDFSQGNKNWYFWTNQTGKGVFTTTNGRGQVEITEPGPYLWSVGISNPGIDIVKGRIYRVEFEAKADPPINMISEIHLDKEPWTSYSKQRTFKLTGKSEKYSYTFIMHLDTDPKAAFQLMFGGQTKSSIIFSNVVITDLGEDKSEIIFPENLEDKKLDKDISDCTVFVFDQLKPKEYDPLIYKVKPDINIRNFCKWGADGAVKTDYDFSNMKKYHYIGILAMGGITTVIDKNEFKSNEDFFNMASRDANNEIVPWNDFLGVGNRGALANPKYRQYLVETCKMLIDGGVDGIHLDEANSPYLGGPAKNWSGNEGFDDYSIADFNRYLMDKYPNYADADWKNNFKMTDDNIIKKDVPADDLNRNFNYRKYLQKNGWTGKTWGKDTVQEESNPLAKEWGKQLGNRLYNDGTFTSVYIKKYLKEIFDEVRAYGMEKYGKKILITCNGIMPCVDFNSLGIYLPNPDNAPMDWNGLDYVPIKNRKLDGTVSIMDIYKKMYTRSKEASGDVPLVFFLDFPNKVINSYYALSIEQKKDFWQIYAAEAYAAGCYYAFHLATVMPDEPTAEESRVLDFFAEYVEYYKNNSDFYHDNDYSPVNVRVLRKNISYNLMEQKKHNRYVLHLINHNYTGKILPQNDFKVIVETGKKPSEIYAISPDFEGKKTIDYIFKDGLLELDMDYLKYYDVIAIEM